MAHTTMNENIYPQIPQIVQIIFSFSLRPPRSLRFIYEGVYHFMSRNESIWHKKTGSKEEDPLKNLSSLSKLKKLFQSNSVTYTTPEQFTDLYTKSHQIVARYILGLTGRQQSDIEDLTAETFTKAWQSRTQFEGSEQAAIGWLLTIARRLVIDKYRYEKHRTPHLSINEITPRANGVTPEQRLVVTEQQTIILQLLQDLPDAHREMIVLRYLLGWSVKRIASHLDMPPNTVSVTMQRSLKKMRAQWPLPDLDIIFMESNA